MSTGFPEPAALQPGSASLSHQQWHQDSKTDESDQAEMEAQPMLEPLPWEAHWVENRM